MSENTQPALTKSRFTTALDCPTKLYYQSHPNKYQNQKSSNPFLQELAKGGHQVGTLAQKYYSHIANYKVGGKGYAEAHAQTMELLNRHNEVAIFEAGLFWGGCFVRVDVLHKKGNILNLLEVKAKSVDVTDEKQMDLTDKKLMPYVEDVAFQYFVAKNTFASAAYIIKPYLFLANKLTPATVNGLNQMFEIKEVNGQVEIVTPQGLTKQDLGNEILIRVDALARCEEIINTKKTYFGKIYTYEEWIAYLADGVANSKRLTARVDRRCFKCEFRCDPEGKMQGKKDGFVECWHRQRGYTEKQLSQPMISEIWRLHYLLNKALINEDRIFIKQLNEADLYNSDGELTPSGYRQWLQVEKVQQNDKSVWFDATGFNAEKNQWKWPLNFIDFETLMPALPLHAGRRPYEQVAFQFSHHVMHQNGKIEHQNQYLSFEKGVFPNFDFVRALKKALSSNNGTIFRYAAHENTVLLQIKAQLNQSTEPDKTELMQWIDTLTEDKKTKRKGARNMVDMLKLVQHYFYSPQMKGSNSIKAVLPAAVAASARLQQKYAQPVYGTDQIGSLNFKNHVWIKPGQQDPYKNLPAVFDASTDDEIERKFTDEALDNGGKAMMAYAKMQFTNITEQERQSLYKALLHYCELDTMAMVMIMELWLNGLQ